MPHHHCQHAFPVSASIMQRSHQGNNSAQASVAAPRNFRAMRQRSAAGNHSFFNYSAVNTRDQGQSRCRCTRHCVHQGRKKRPHRGRQRTPGGAAARRCAAAARRRPAAGRTWRGRPRRASAPWGRPRPRAAATASRSPCTCALTKSVHLQTLMMLRKTMVAGHVQGHIPHCSVHHKVQMQVRFTKVTGICDLVSARENDTWCHCRRIPRESRE